MTNLKYLNSRRYALGIFLSALVSTLQPIHATWQPAEIVSNPAIQISHLNGPTLSVNPQGNAIAVWTDEGTSTFPNESAITSSFYTRGIGWSAPQVISSLALNPFDKPLYTAQGDHDVRMNSSNYAVVAWEGEYSDEPFPSVIFGTVRQSNGAWGPVEILSEFNEDFLGKNPNVSVNDAGTAAVAYRKQDTAPDSPPEYTMVTTLPLGGTWSTPISISSAPEEAKGEGNSKPDIAINSSGDLVVVWYRRFPSNIYGIDAATYNAATGTWSSSVTLDSIQGDNFGENPKCAIDEKGNAVAIWLNYENGTIRTAFFTKGSGWGPTLNLGNNATDGPTVVMDPAGNATAIWPGNALTRVIFSAYKPINGVWGAPEIISTGAANEVRPFQSQEPLAVSKQGNVIAVWNSDNGILYSAYRLFNQPWQDPEIVFSLPNQVLYESVGLASCGFAVALWDHSSTDTVRAAVNENILTPFNTSHRTCRQTFASQRILLNILNWNTSSKCCIRKFNIYCNGKLIGHAPSRGPNQFIYTKDCKLNCNYTITSINIWGFESDPVPFN
ncbi:MAG: hypothetical protein H0U49_12290 [Parachlamydiaceae bacterium]|nr:hypothetical protein [Parachlamydiaceae bacterium]